MTVGSSNAPALRRRTLLRLLAGGVARSGIGRSPIRSFAPGLALDWPLPDGHFFTQANGDAGGRNLGFAVTNDAGVPFWDEFRARGGVAALGYPVLHRFQMDGFEVQAFQKAVLQSWPLEGVVRYVNILDRLSELGFDGWLESQRMIPRPFDASADANLSWPEIVARHMAILEAEPAIRAKFLSEPDWLTIHGLPMSVRDMGSAVVVRAQRAAFQRWKVATEFAAVGEVTVVNAGDLLKEAGLLPAEAVVPEERTPEEVQVLGGIEQRIVNYHNWTRLKNGLAPMRVNHDWYQAAQDLLALRLRAGNWGLVSTEAPEWRCFTNAGWSVEAGIEPDPVSFWDRPFPAIDTSWSGGAPRFAYDRQPLVSEMAVALAWDSARVAVSALSFR